MKSISANEVRKLKAEKHVVIAYPRKGQICVDGFRYFKASPAAIKAAVA